MGHGGVPLQNTSKVVDRPGGAPNKSGIGDAHMQARHIGSYQIGIEAMRGIMRE